MALLSIPKMKDYRKQVTKHPSNRYVKRRNGIKSITHIAIHHSATLRKLAGSNAEGYAGYHVNALGWPGIGYTYVIEADGIIKYVNELDVKTYHVGDHNNYAVGICLSGDFSNEDPTKEQEQSLRNLVAALQKKYPHMKEVKGHSDFSGYEWKACPMFDYKKVLAQGSVSPNPKPAPTGEKLVVDGLLGPKTIGALQRHFKTPVDGYFSKPSTVIKAMQKWLGTPVDGYISEPYSPMLAKLQRKLGTPVDGKISRPSPMVKELQRRLNSGKGLG